LAVSIRDAVKEGYGQVARAGLSSEQEGVAAIAKAFGYSETELASIPAEANMGLSCGNPIALASLRPGEVVLDLGSGGGLDVFLAADKVGSTGRAIGIDMTEDMVELARRNAAKSGHSNVEFHLATIESMPLADNSVDCVISNCVLNLVEDKPRAFAEIARVLKPGGRLAASDIALRKALPTELESEVAAWIGCIAGAISIDDNRTMLEAAGFSEVRVVDAKSDLNVYKEAGAAACCAPAAEATTGCCSPKTEPDPAFHDQLTALLESFDINEYAASVKIFAVAK
jgi:SAM-dependent methyltransferase